ncbi:KTSC domain-containing protein [Parasediminibacterium sp. JCM 36343]|uniref:KTSC domain-containing protein n=1 Tax=Parasediminibacterium sp. JCM 36343 TaxID=3374279 RepID=UPI00397D58BB
MTEYVAIDSTVFDLVGYDEKRQVLEVHYIASGYTFAYEGVPMEEFESLLDAKSKDKYLQYITDSYEGYRINAKQSR